MVLACAVLLVLVPTWPAVGAPMPDGPMPVGCPADLGRHGGTVGADTAAASCDAAAPAVGQQAAVPRGRSRTLPVVVVAALSLLATTAAAVALAWRIRRRG